MAYATAEDLATYMGRALSTSEAAQADGLLDYASMKIDARVANPDASVARYVCMDMVKTAFAGGSGAAIGAGQASVTAGPYTTQYTYASPVGDLYWKRQYDIDLGVAGLGIASIRADNALGGDEE